MTDVDAMLAWTRSQILADKAAAEVATPGPWAVNSEIYVERITAEDGTAVIDGGRWGGEASVFEHTADAIHIARNGDPRDVIARCESDLAILDDYERARNARYIGTETPDQYIIEPYIRHLAQGYRHRDGYKEGWSR